MLRTCHAIRLALSSDTETEARLRVAAGESVESVDKWWRAIEMERFHNGEYDDN